ncbi:hypothetical protein LY78DRAFT_401263 [Colletotrichum sublineola]|nr:hypothetical protein LY78DRAFT_401263 [Colletotrichum sublineola]
MGLPSGPQFFFSQALDIEQRTRYASGSELVCSYNWRTGHDVRVYIPGFAAIWQDLPLPITLAKDKGAYFVDQNAERVPEFPFEPLFRATATMNQSFRFDDVDPLVNRNSLRKLLDFCAGRHKTVLASTFT